MSTTKEGKTKVLPKGRDWGKEPTPKKGGGTCCPSGPHPLARLLGNTILYELLDAKLVRFHDAVMINSCWLQVETAAYDPIFWFHHSYIDCLYEQFRDRQKKLGVEPMRDWPAEHGDSAHAPFAPMRIGSLRNIDGAQEFFSKEIVRCEPVPACTEDSQCGTYMRCDKPRRKCISDTLKPPEQASGVWGSLDSIVSSVWRNRLASVNNPLTGSSFGFGSVFQQPEIFRFSNSG